MTAKQKQKPSFCYNEVFGARKLRYKRHFVMSKYDLLPMQWGGLQQKLRIKREFEVNRYRCNELMRRRTKVAENADKTRLVCPGGSPI